MIPGATALATRETGLETALQAACPHQSEDRPPATVPRKTPRPILRGAAGSPVEPGVKSSTASNGRGRVRSQADRASISPERETDPCGECLADRTSCHAAA